MKKRIIATGLVALLASTAAQAERYGGPEYQDPNYPISGQYGGGNASYNGGGYNGAGGSTKISWAGLYVGGSFGKSWGKAKTSLKNRATDHTIVRKEVSPDSTMWGGYVGYNFQTTNNMVIGIETDFLWNTDGESGSKLYLDGNGNAYNYKATVKQRWNGATRLRIGFIKGASDRFLPYVAGGISYANIRARSGTHQTTNTTEQDSKLNSDKRTGWNIGAGIDYIPPIMNNHLILRAEYRYTDFGEGSFNKGSYNHANNTVANIKQRVKFRQNDIRLGIAYKF